MQLPLNQNKAAHGALFLSPSCFLSLLTLTSLKKERSCADSHLQCPVEWVQQDLGKGYNLGGAVPSVRTVHQDGTAFPLHC